MVWIGGPRGRRQGGVKSLVLHDPPPGYRRPRPRVPLRERQRKARQDWVLEHIFAVILIAAAAAVAVIIVLMLVGYR